MKQRFRFLAIILPIWIIAAVFLAFALWAIQGSNFAISFIVALVALTPAFFPDLLHFRKIGLPTDTRVRKIARVVFRGICYAIGLITLGAFFLICRLWSQGRMAEISIVYVVRPELFVILPFMLFLGIGFAFIQEIFPDK